MTTHIPLTPPVERLLKEQLATGRYHDAGDVVEAALRLLNQQTPPPAAGTGDDAFGLWKGRSPDGLAYEQRFRADWTR
jgi:hypothetical protein